MSKDRKREVSNLHSIKNSADNLESSSYHSPPEFTPTVQPVQRQSISDKEKKVAGKGLQSSNGLPENLQQNMEAMSGMDLSDVSVHRNSSKPAQLQAEAYAQGSDIHLSPGKEQHLPHEAWHVVQQKQGRVQANTSIAGQGVNDSEALESEADKMGAKASSSVLQQKSNFTSGGSGIGSAPVQMWNPFKRKGRKKGKDDHHVVGGLGENVGNASDVNKVTTKGEIGNSGTNKGFAKKAMPDEGRVNPTIENLGLPFNPLTYETTENPNLLARQVVSSRLDQALGLNVLAEEVFGKDGNQNLGITAAVAGTQMMENLEVDDPSAPGGKKPMQRHNHFDFSNPQMMQGLSNLQLMDAITGQLDRHLGNIFVDENGNVKGIDNDMAFGRTAWSNEANENVPSANIQAGHVLANQFTGDFDQDTFEFNMEYVDEKAAQSVLAMSEKDFIKILKGNKSDAERLGPDDIKMALARFRAIQRRLRELEKNGELVSDWSDQSQNYYQKMQGGFIPNPDGNRKFERHTNYVARAARRYEESGLAENQGQMIQGQDPNKWNKAGNSGGAKKGFSIGSNRSQMQAPNYPAPLPPGPKKPNYPAPMPPGPKKPDYPAPKIPLESQLLPHRMLGPSPEMQMIGSLMNSPMLDQEYNGEGDSTKEEDDSDWD